MTCQICHKRKATQQAYHEDWRVLLHVCAICFRQVFPTPEQMLQDEQDEERRCERQAEQDACHYLMGGW